MKKPTNAMPPLPERPGPAPDAPRAGHDGRDKDARTLLVVDDTKDNLTVLGGLLQPAYRVRLALGGEQALRLACREPRPELILLDVMMPGMDGYEVLRRLRQMPETRDIPVIFVTAMNADEDEEKGLCLGAVDYITKPIRPAILLARVRTHLELKQARDWLRDQNGYLEREIKRRTRETCLIKDISLNALAMLAETRDNETGNHLRRTQAYVEALMRRLRGQPKHKDELADARQALIAKATPLHDIGKVGIPDHILLKPGKLTAEEFTVMKRHSQIGAQAIDDAIQRVLGDNAAAMQAGLGDSPLAFLDMARVIALSHHEKWNGSGYPEGLAGEAIPLPARLMAVADVYDALSCRRHYKPAHSEARVVETIRAGAGAHFDPEIVEALDAARDEFKAIAEHYADAV
jgi:putative two-component system response regulator